MIFEKIDEETFRKVLELTEVGVSGDLVHVEAYRGDRLEGCADLPVEPWGDRLGDEVLSYIDATAGDRFELRVVRANGERCGADECYDTVASLEIRARAA